MRRKRKSAGNVIEHPVWRAMRLEEQCDLLLDAVQGLYDATRDESGARDVSTELGAARHRARLALQAADVEVGS